MSNLSVGDRLAALEATWSPSVSSFMGDPIGVRLAALEAAASPTRLSCMQDQVEARLDALEATTHGSDASQTVFHEIGQF